MHNVNLSLEYATAQAAAGALANGGYLRYYGGEQPATADTPVSRQKLLAELRIGSPAGKASAGDFIFAEIESEKSARAAGEATWYRVYKADGRSSVRDGSIGATGSGSDIELDDTNISLGAEVRCDELKWRVPR
jgi:formylmethanofuran:tetrahydromethanopterin formyltransferase